MDIFSVSALELAQKIKSREMSAPEAVKAVAASMSAKEETFNCYTSFDEEEALKCAADVQKRIDAGEELSPLAGACPSPEPLGHWHGVGGMCWEHECSNGAFCACRSVSEMSTEGMHSRT